MNPALYPGVLRKVRTMKGKLGNKIIFEAGKTLWSIVSTFNVPMLLYPYTYRHLQYSSKILRSI